MEPAKIPYRRRPKPDTLRLWTIQPPHVWEALRQYGTLLVDPAHPDFGGHEKSFGLAYDWLRGQMQKRIPGYANHYPWWAYEHFLDLRFYRWHTGQFGQRRVRLELAVPKEKVLLSAYGDWHTVLSRGYLPEALDWDAYEREWDAWDAQAYGNVPFLEKRYFPLAEPWQTLLEQSWERIFDVNARRPTNTIQANFERLELSDVVSVTAFTSRRNR